MVGGWSDKTKLILISTLVEVVVEVALGNNKDPQLSKSLNALKLVWIVSKIGGLYQ